MTTLTPCLVFESRGEEAVKFYVSLVKNSRIISLRRSDADGGPFPKGALMQAEFELDGQRFNAFDGGPHFTFSEAFSLMVSVDTQAEIDALWSKLTADGGRESQCGWLVDRWGLSWQIIPSSLGAMLSDGEHGNAKAATDAMLKMRKLDIAALEAAYRS
jgi:predicted 3-demethylubiquinone-9 3-methyltransferase (glyoxalase superfamily)